MAFLTLKKSLVTLIHLALLYRVLDKVKTLLSSVWFITLSLLLSALPLRLYSSRQFAARMWAIADSTSANINKENT